MRICIEGIGVKSFEEVKGNQPYDGSKACVLIIRALRLYDIDLRILIPKISCGYAYSFEVVLGGWSAVPGLHLLHLARGIL